MSDKPFLYPSLYIDWVEKINGWGVYTKDDIKGKTIVEICPVIVYPEEILKIASWQTNGDKQAYATLGFTLYSLNWNENYAAVPLGYGGIYNHSDTNNCQFVCDVDNGMLYIVATRDINSGEQLTVHYGDGWFDSKPFPKIDI